MLKSPAILFLDCQTTGASPATSSLLELACNERSWVLKQEEDIPRQILRMVGITPEEIRQGACSKDVFTELSETIVQMQAEFSDKLFAVAHFSRIEQIYLDRLWLTHAAEKFPLPIVCSHKMAKLIYPRLPNYGLRALAGWFGMPLDEGKRAINHVTATKQIWDALVIELDKKGVNSLDELLEFLDQKPVRTTGRRDFLIPREKRLSLPSSPGVYRYIDRNGKVLYVGKATSLKARVNSYFTGGCRGDHRKLEMLAQAVDVEVTPTAIPLNAGLLEYDEIRRLKPPYNIAFKSQGRDPMKPLTLLIGSNDNFEPTLHAQVIRDHFNDLIDMDMLRDGIKLWRLQRDIAPDHVVTERELLNLALPLLKAWIEEETEKRRSRHQQTEENDPELSESDESPVEDELLCWTPEMVAHQCNKIIRRAVRHFIRSKWLSRLSRATIELDLTAKGHETRKKKPNTLTIPPSEEIHQFDQRRIRVLLHELRRAESKGGNWRITQPWPMTVPFWV